MFGSRYLRWRRRISGADGADSASDASAAEFKPTSTTRSDAKAAAKQHSAGIVTPNTPTRANRKTRGATASTPCVPVAKRVRGDACSTQDEQPDSDASPAFVRQRVGTDEAGVAAVPESSSRSCSCRHWGSLVPMLSSCVWGVVLLRAQMSHQSSFHLQSSRLATRVGLW